MASIIHCEVAIIGAGPYGLSAAAHLQAAQRDVYIFGEPMGFWRNAIPPEMVLRSAWRYCDIADPHGMGTLHRFVEIGGLQPAANLNSEQFLKYGEWFHRKLVPNVDRRRITRIERTDRGFLLCLGDGGTCTAQRVVVATGLAHHQKRPPQFDWLPRAVCSHASEHNRFAPFAGQRVAVIGAGQSALESAVLLRENGAEVEVIARAPGVHWLGAGTGNGDLLRRTVRPVVRRFIPPPHTGPFPLNIFLEQPGLFRLAPANFRRKIAQLAHRPAAAAWLQSRSTGLRITTGVSVISASRWGGQIELKLDDGTQKYVHHVLLATGYRFDISNLPFLPADLFSQIRSERGYPVLSKSMESSVPRLHFIGVAASDAFGPSMGFLSGTGYCSRSLTRGICREEVPMHVPAPKADAAAAGDRKAIPPRSL
jgi:pyridine nucleotide-disulfide oxidoreductase